MAEKKFRPEEVQQELGPGQYIKYSDMTIWDQPGEGGADLYVFAPAMTEDELMALEEQAGGEAAPMPEAPPSAPAPTPEAPPATPQAAPPVAPPAAEPEA